MQKVLIDNINYELNLDSHTASVCSLDNGKYSGDIVIPATITYNNTAYSVTSVGNWAFSGCTNLTSITIPDSVTSIGDYAFSDCGGLTSITIPNSVTSIGSWAFSDCTGLTSITIPNSVTNIGSSAFRGCIGLISITVEQDNKKYDSRNNCNAIIETATNTLIVGCTNTTIPNSVASIGDSAFLGCNSLTYITIPNSVTSIGYGAFRDCESLASVAIPDSITSIGSGAFEGCTCLTSITIPNSVTSIGDGAFANTPWIDNQPDGEIYINTILYEYKGDMPAGSNIVVREDTTSIGGWAFSDCTGLTSITIPNSVTSIGNSAFCGCTGLTSIMIPDSVTRIGFGAFERCIGLTSITIPHSVTRIASCTFSDCTNLTSVTIGNGVTSIEWGAFFRCSGLTSITIPNSVTEIQSLTFQDCTSLISITISNSVTRIGGRAFRGCTSLASITIPDSVTEIGDFAIIGNTATKVGIDGAFKDCKTLSTIRILCGKINIFTKSDLNDLQDKIVEYIEALIEGIQYQLDDTMTAVVCANKEPYTGDIVVPAQVKHEGKTYTVNRLGDRAFADCYGLTAVTLPKSITEIGKDVFLGCENLQTIRVPQGMTDKFCQMGLEPWRDKIVEPRQEEYTILLNIARGYELGIGMARNLAQAVLCYAQAADKGCAEAAYHLGELYAEGKGLPQDYQQAADWFGKAAALYHPNGAARQQECLRIIEQEAARLAAFEQEQQAERQAQLARITAAPKSQKTILFFDTETNGLPRNYKADITNTFNWPRLIQLGWLITDEAGNILKRKSQLIYPHFTIDTDVTRLTGITTAQAQREGVDLAQVLREFAADAAGASLIVGHNIDFDLHVVGCELYREGMDYRALLNQPTVCTMQRSTDFCAIPSTNSYYSGYKYPTLTELYTKLFGHAFSGAHDALTDITATKDCYFELRKRGII